MDALTLEEFAQEVKETFAAYWRTLNQSEIDEYFEAEETKQYIKGEYDEAIKAFNEGRITDAQLRIGRVGSLAECLALLY